MVLTGGDCMYISQTAQSRELFEGKVIPVAPDSYFLDGTILGGGSDISKRKAKQADPIRFPGAPWVIYLNRVVNRANLNQFEWHWVPWDDWTDGIICYINEPPRSGDTIAIEEVYPDAVVARVSRRYEK